MDEDEASVRRTNRVYSGRSRGRRRWAGVVSSVAAALTLTLTLLAVGAPALAEPPIWHVHGAKADVTMFGSVHLLSADAHWLTPALTQELAEADALWFEIPIDAAGQAEAGRLALQYGMLPPDRSLASVVGPTVWAKLERTAQTVHLPIEALQRMKPWLAEITLEVLAYQDKGARTDLGVEQQLAKAAPPATRREAFETIGEQLRLFADVPTAEQTDSLNATLDEIKDDPDEFERLATAWTRGDIRRLEDDALGPMQREAPGAYKRLIVARNRRFVERIEAMLKGSPGGGPSGRVLIVVGIGHLVGPDGLPALLRRDGFTVQGP